MATPVVPSQFAVGKNRIIHKPTTATFSFETGHNTFKSINWGRGASNSSGLITVKTHHTRCAVVAEQAAKVRSDMTPRFHHDPRQRGRRF
jgi:hypothetical protein